MIRIISTCFLLTLFFSCTVKKTIIYPLVSDGDRSAGTLTMVYEYRSNQVIDVQWDAAKKRASERCQAWGYKGAEFFDTKTSDCILKDRNNNCTFWRATYKCQCITDDQSKNAEASESVSSSGTGFAISSNGYIVTNNHVVQDARMITIKGVNGDFEKTYNARLVVADKNNDLAILQIVDDKFTTLDSIPFGLLNTVLDAGSSVFCLGFPLRETMGDEIKVTNGIISSKTGYQGDITTYQIMMPVQPGNSGGPLFDDKGNLIGVVNAKHSGAENAAYGIKTLYLSNLISSLPDNVSFPSQNKLTTLPLTKQIESLKGFTYIIESLRY